MQEFSKQNAKMDMASEMMDDAMEDMFEVDEGEADDLVNQVCVSLLTAVCLQL
jgi:hypothetical protein